MDEYLLRIYVDAGRLVAELSGGSVGMAWQAGITSAELAAKLRTFADAIALPVAVKARFKQEELTNGSSVAPGAPLPTPRYDASAVDQFKPIAKPEPGPFSSSAERSIGAFDLPPHPLPLPSPGLAKGSDSKLGTLQPTLDHLRGVGRQAAAHLQAATWLRADVAPAPRDEPTGGRFGVTIPNPARDLHGSFSGNAPSGLWIDPALAAVDLFAPGAVDADGVIACVAALITAPICPIDHQPCDTPGAVLCSDCPNLKAAP